MPRSTSKVFQFPLHRDPRCNVGCWVLLLPIAWGFSSLYIGILAATCIKTALSHSISGFSSLYIGILAATKNLCDMRDRVARFSSLYIGILAATLLNKKEVIVLMRFQFPLHRDPRCNQGVLDLVVEDDTFQFPLHRDPRCNRSTRHTMLRQQFVSVPFTSGSSLQRVRIVKWSLP